MRGFVGMKVFVVTLGSLVVKVTDSRESAEDYVFWKSGFEDQGTDCEMRYGSSDRSVCYQKSGTSGRWVKNGYAITATGFARGGQR